MSRNGRILFVLLVLATITGCSILSRSDEVVLAATDVGTPTGDPVTKVIGAAGGTLASPDGRFTLTVPQNAVSETTTFSIQPITNTLKTGLGNAYRFGPDGKTFATTPLELAVRFDEDDLKGADAETLAVAFQDSEGSWHVLKPKVFDAANKTITIPITHFTDFSFLARWRIAPTQGKVRPGESLSVGLVVACKKQGLLDRLLQKPLDCDSPPAKSIKWSLYGPGGLDVYNSELSARYTAPAKRPPLGRVEVEAKVRFDYYERWDPNTGEQSSMEKAYRALIFITDQVYEAKARGGDVSFYGTICSLDEPFTIEGNILNYQFQFTPSSGTAGTFTLSMAGLSVIGEGGGTYTIEGLESGKPRIVTKGTSTGHSPVGSITKAGAFDFQLTALENAECREG